LTKEEKFGKHLEPKTRRKLNYSQKALKIVFEKEINL